MKVIRNNATYPGILNGYQKMSGAWKNSNSGSTARTLTIEAHVATILRVHCVYDATNLAPTIADSTTYPGYKKVSFTVPAGKVAYYTIEGTNESVTDYAEADADTTIDDDEVY